MDPELVFRGDAAHLVARPRRAVRVEQELGDQEQRDAARAGRRVRRARQHHVDGVLGVVVLAEGDEDLGAADPVMVALAHRPGPERADVGAGVRLGQAHGAGPFAADQLGQIARALLRGAVMEQQLHPGLGQDRAEAEREVGAVPHLPHRGRPRSRAGPGRPTPAGTAARASRPRRTSGRPPCSPRACAPRRSPAARAADRPWH